MNIQFKVPGNYTRLRVSEWMATTDKDEITITGFQDTQKQYTYKHKGSKKEYLFPLTGDCLLFEGHNLPLLVDSETSRFMGNACFNFVTDNPEELKEYIQKYCLNPDPCTFAKIMVTPAMNRDTAHSPSYTPLFTDYETED